MYRLVATMRKTNEDIVICEWSKLYLFETIIDNFDYSDTISRFSIWENNEMVREKVLAPDAKNLVKRRIRDAKEDKR